MIGQRLRVKQRKQLTRTFGLLPCLGFELSIFYSGNWHAIPAHNHLLGNYTQNVISNLRQLFGFNLLKGIYIFGIKLTKQNMTHEKATYR